MFIFYMYVITIILSLVAYSYQNVKFNLELKKQAQKFVMEGKLEKIEKIEKFEVIFKELLQKIEIEKSLKKIEIKQLEKELFKRPKCMVFKPYYKPYIVFLTFLC